MHVKAALLHTLGFNYICGGSVQDYPLISGRVERRGEEKENVTQNCKTLDEKCRCERSFWNFKVSLIQMKQPNK